ncbi:MAG TPA: hypothetical protein VIF57_10650 [Polyangia bacterium]|jgi:hypothetical protein
MSDGEPERPELIAPARVAAEAGADGVGHLAENRRLIVRRALLATAVGGVIPIPVLDDYFSGRVRAGMLAKIAERRRVDLAPGSADLLGDAREGNAVRNVTLTAAAFLAIKLAWRKFFALLAIGRRADEMATSYQLGMVFDHYCAKVHVGGGVDRAQAAMLRQVIFAALSDSERQAFVVAFREGGKVLGRSFLEAPNWLSDRVRLAAERWAESGGKSTDPDEAAAVGDAAEEVRWLDRAAAAVETRLGRAEQGYLTGLTQAFERRWREAQARKQAGPRQPGAPDADRGPGA